MDRSRIRSLYYYASQGLDRDVESLLNDGVNPDGYTYYGKTPLMLAVEGSHIECVKLLVKFGANLYSTGGVGLTVLHQAATAGKLEIVQCLVNSNRISLDVKSVCDGKTPLMLAAQHSQVEVAELLMNSGADIQCTSSSGWTALHYAACHGSVEVVGCFTSGRCKGALDLKSVCDGKTPLMVATQRSHREITELLINAGADIHCCKPNGWTVLHYAANQGSVEIVQCLADKGVVLDVKNSHGETPMMLAAKGSHRGVVELLIKLGADIHTACNSGTVLHYASGEGSVEIVQCLVNNSVGLDVKSIIDGKTPLMVAAQCSHIEIVELLINSGADIHCCNDNGWTVLHYASDKGSVAIVQCLLDKGVALDVKNSYGQTPLMLAAQESRREVFELLINSGADIHCCNDNGWTVLHHAAGKGSVEIVQYLVNKKVALDVKSTDGQTPLMVAIQRSHIAVVELLIKSGADIHCCNSNGWSMLHLASYAGLFDIVQYLVSESVALDIKNCNGETPLHFAVKMEVMKIADYLLKAGSDCNLENNEGESPFTILIKKQNPNVETVKLCIEKGAYVKSTDYNRLFENPRLKLAILQDTSLCSQIVINKFNNKDLPLLYKGLASAWKLPYFDHMKINNGSGMALEVEQAVTEEIKAKGVCNVFEMVPVVLSILSIKSAIEKLKPAGSRANQLESQNGLKRSGCHDQQDNDCKKKCLKKL